MGCFPELDDLLSIPDEGDACYQYFIWMFSRFEEALEEGARNRAGKYLQFVLRALGTELHSDSEDLQAAAGVCFAEHLFDERSEEDWQFILSLMSREDYLLCRPYLQNWLDAEEFIKAEGAADHHYA